MSNIEKILEGLECCKDINKLNCDYCPYDYNARSDRCECTAELAMDALKLFKSLRRAMQDLLIVPNFDGPGHMPVKNTSRLQCYKALYIMQDLLQTQTWDPSLMFHPDRPSAKFMSSFLKGLEKAVVTEDDEA